MSSENNMSTCAACGKGGSGLKTCNGCKMVKYCNAICQKEHRPKHKKECKKRAAELKDEALFKKPPRNADCPICFETLPLIGLGVKYQPCCGTTVCTGCIYTAGEKDESWPPCPFCRAPGYIGDEETIKRMKKRADGGDALATYQLGCRYRYGSLGMPLDYRKAFELCLRAGELGYTMAYCNVGAAYCNGQGAERDEKKAIHYYELAAMDGDVYARHGLGEIEAVRGNTDRAVKHWMIAAGGGYDESLKKIREGYMKGLVTKDNFAKALRAHKEAKDEMRSDQRDAAAAALGFTY